MFDSQTVKEEMHRHFAMEREHSMDLPVFQEHANEEPLAHHDIHMPAGPYEEMPDFDPMADDLPTSMNLFQLEEEQ